MDDVESLLTRLVSIDSVNPSLVPGARGETEIGLFVADWLRTHALEVRPQETSAPGRPNVIALVQGTGGGRTLMLNAHMDTVGTIGMASPFEPVVRDGKLYGRGAMDTKGALAAFMCAAADAAAAARRKLRGDVLLTAVVDEEYASIGTEAVVREHRADAAIVGEPSGLQVITEHKGFAWFEIETTGVAAHGSLPGYRGGCHRGHGQGPGCAGIRGKAPGIRAATPHACHRVPACLAHQRRPGAFKLPGVLPAVSGEADRTGGDRGYGRGRAAVDA